LKIKLFSLFHIIIRIYVHILHQQLSILENTISVFFVALAFTIRGAKLGENWIIIIKQDVVNVCIVIVVFRCAIWFFFHSFILFFALTLCISSFFKWTFKHQSFTITLDKKEVIFFIFHQKFKYSLKFFIKTVLHL